MSVALSAAAQETHAAWRRRCDADCRAARIASVLWYARPQRCAAIDGRHSRVIPPSACGAGAAARAWQAALLRCQRRVDPESHRRYFAQAKVEDKIDLRRSVRRSKRCDACRKSRCLTSDLSTPTKSISKTTKRFSRGFAQRRTLAHRQCGFVTCRVTDPTQSDPSLDSGAGLQ